MTSSWPLLPPFEAFTIDHVCFCPIAWHSLLCFDGRNNRPPNLPSGAPGRAQRPARATPSNHRQAARLCVPYCRIRLPVNTARSVERRATSTRVQNSGPSPSQGLEVAPKGVLKAERAELSQKRFLTREGGKTSMPRDRQRATLEVQLPHPEGNDLSRRTSRLARGSRGTPNG